MGQREESRYHMLGCMTQIAEANFERVRLEEQFSRGNGELLPQFRSFQDLYNSKIQQRSIFENLRRLLEQKSIAVGQGSAIGSPTSALAKGIEATFDAFGGTNIMTLNDQGP